MSGNAVAAAGRSGTGAPRILIAVEGGDWPEESTLSALAARAVEAGLGVCHARLARNAELSILFADDDAVAELNRDWRGKDGPTNVLSFPGGDHRPDRPDGPMIGDVALAAGVLRREAEAGGLAIEDHLTHLLVHGLLHCLGYDHETDDDAELMEGLEREALARLGIADPYR